MSKFSDRFRQLKEEKQGITLKELSVNLGITVPNLSYYMKGREPSYDILIKIADYFNVSTDWLIGRTDARSSESLDTIDIVENKLGVEPKDRLSDKALENYLEIQYIVFDILEDAYAFYLLNDVDFTNEFQRQFCMPIVTIAHNLHEYIKVFKHRNLSKDKILKFVQNTDLIADVIPPLILINSYGYANYLSHFEDIPEKDAEMLHGIIDFTFNKFSEKYPNEKLFDMFDKMNELCEDV